MGAFWVLGRYVPILRGVYVLLCCFLCVVVINRLARGLVLRIVYILVFDHALDSGVKASVNATGSVIF